MPGPPAALTDAPTLVRPDLQSLAELEAEVAGPPVAPSPFPPDWDEDPEDAPTVRHIRRTLPEEPTERATALHEELTVRKAASIHEEATVRQSSLHDEPTVALKPSDIVGDLYSPPVEAPKQPARRSVPPRSGEGARKRKKTRKKVQVAREGQRFDDERALQPLHLLYGAVGIGGLLLVAGAFVAGVIILLYMPTS